MSGAAQKAESDPLMTGAPTPKQARFVHEYLIDLNASQAAIRAGYSARNADKIGSELLGKTRVRAAIGEAQKARERRTLITADRVVGELALIAFSNTQDYIGATGAGDPFVDLSGLSREQWAAVQEVTVEDFVDGRGKDRRDVRRVKFKLADKRAALVDLGRHLGIFTDKLEHLGKDGGPIAIELSIALRLANAVARLERGAATHGR